MQPTTKLLPIVVLTAHRKTAQYAAACLQTPDVCAFPLGSLAYASCVFHSESEALFGVRSASPRARRCSKVAIPPEKDRKRAGCPPLACQARYVRRSPQYPQHEWPRGASRRCLGSPQTCSPMLPNFDWPGPSLTECHPGFSRKLYNCNLFCSLNAIDHKAPECSGTQLTERPLGMLHPNTGHLRVSSCISHLCIML